MKEIIEFFKGCGTSCEKLCLAIVMVIIFLILPIEVARYGWVAVMMAAGYEIAAFRMLVHYVCTAKEAADLEFFENAIEAKQQLDSKKKEDAA